MRNYYSSLVVIISDTFVVPLVGFFLSFFSFAVKKRNSKKHVVVEKHVRQLGEKSNRRIISRLDGTAVFGREYGRERVWARFWFFLSLSLALFCAFKAR